MRLTTFLKPFVLTIAIVVLLQASGFMGTVSFITQSAMLKSGIMNAETEELKAPKDFDYNFEVVDLAGNKIKFEQFKGKVVFLNLWATWCGPCRAEMADIQKLYEKISNEKIVFVMLSLDESKNKPKVDNYIREKAFTFPVFMPSGYLTEQLLVKSIPTTFVISKDGKIIMKELGSKNYNTDEFKTYLEEKASL